MRAQTPTPDDFPELEQAVAALEREAARVGVEWRAVEAAFLASLEGHLEPTAAEDADEPLLGLDVFASLAALRGLPDGAGTEAFLTALDRWGTASEPPAA